MIGGGGAVGGIEANRFGIVLQRTAAVALLDPGRAAVVVGALEFWIEFQRSVVVRDGAVVIPLRLIRVAAVGQEFRLGTDLDCFVVIGDRARIVTVAGEVEAAIVEEFRLRRIDPDRRGNILDRPFRAAQLAVGRGTVAVGARAVRLETERLVVIGNRLSDTRP